MSVAVRRRIAALAVAALSFGTAGPAAAIQDCRDARAPIPGAQGPVYKLVLDDVQVLGDLDQGILGRVLRTRLQANVEKIALDVGEIHIIVCPGRAPLNPGDIGNEVDGFTDAGVVLEIWGVFDGDEAIFTKAVVPLLSTGAQGWAPSARFFEDSFLYDPDDPDDSALRFLKDVVGDSLRMRSYAAVGIASRALMVGDYDRARNYFCRASLMLGEVATDPDFGPGEQQLADFVARMALETVTRAAEDAAYQGVLGTANMPVGEACPELVS